MNIINPDKKKSQWLYGIKYPFTRRILSSGYQHIIKYLFGLELCDTQVGLKVFKKEVLNKILPKVIVKKFAFDLEVLVLAHKYGYKIKEVPTKIDFKLGSTVSPRAIIRIFLDTLSIFYRLKILRSYDK